eukprot:UN13286
MLDVKKIFVAQKLLKNLNRVESIKQSVRDSVQNLARYDPKFKDLKPVFDKVEEDVEHYIDSMEYENIFMVRLYTMETKFFVLLIKVFVKVMLVNISMTT